MKIDEGKGYKLYDTVVIRYLDALDNIINTKHTNSNGLVAVSKDSVKYEIRSVEERLPRILMNSKYAITFDDEVIKGFFDPDPAAKINELQVIDYEVSGGVLYISIPFTWEAY